MKNYFYGRDIDYRGCDEGGLTTQHILTKLVYEKYSSFNYLLGMLTFFHYLKPISV